MSVPSSPTGTANALSLSISSSALAEAAERRTRQATPQLTSAQLAAKHERRQKFRRLVDPGITRPNPKDKAMSSLKVYESLIHHDRRLLNAIVFHVDFADDIGEPFA
jgi:hypothetical protein